MASPYNHPQVYPVTGTISSVDHHPQPTAVRGATTADIADFTSVSVTQGGVTHVAGERVLVKAQTDPIENGIYAFGEVSAGLAPLVRVAPMVDGENNHPGMLVWVQEGTERGYYVGRWTYPLAVGTDAIEFSQVLLGYTVPASAVMKVSITADHTTITAAAAFEVINIGASLPANAQIVGCNIKLATPFSGGTIADFTVDVGTAGDDNAIVAAADLFAAAVDGQASSVPDGIAPNKHFPAGGQMIATFRCASDNVGDATAGACTIEVLYIVLP